MRRQTVVVQASPLPICVSDRGEFSLHTRESHDGKTRGALTRVAIERIARSSTLDALNLLLDGFYIFY